MDFPQLTRIALFGLAACGWCAPGLAQQSQKRAAGNEPAQKSGAKPAPKSANSKIQQVDGKGTAPGRQRLKAPEMRIEALPPELEQILKEWELESAKIKRIVGEHERIVYNSVFEVQKIAKGQFYYEAPDKGRIDLVGIEPKKGEKSKRVNEKTGKSYRIEKETPSKWICTGKEILNINEEEKSFEVFPLPEDLQGVNIINGPLPFLFGMKAEDAKKRFAISFADQEDRAKNNKEVVWLVAKPRQNMDRDNFREAVIILDRKRYLPLAVRLIDPSGNLETVYTFPEDELLVNGRQLLPEPFRNDPFHPKLKSYKMILPPEATNTEQKKSDSAGNRAKTIRQASNTKEVPANPKTGGAPKSGTSTQNRTKK